MSRVTLLAPGDVVRSCEAELAQRNINVRVVSWEEVVEADTEVVANQSVQGRPINGTVQPKNLRTDAGNDQGAVRGQAPETRTAHEDAVAPHDSGAARMCPEHEATDAQNDRRTDSRDAAQHQPKRDEAVAGSDKGRANSHTHGVEKTRKGEGGEAVRISKGGGGGTANGASVADTTTPGGKTLVYVADQRICDRLAGEIVADVRVFPSAPETAKDAIFVSLGAALLKSLGVPKDAVSRQKDAQTRLRRLEKTGHKIEIQHYESISTLHDDFGKSEKEEPKTVRSGVVFVSNDPALAVSAPIVFTVPTGDTTWKDTMRRVTSRRNVRVYRGEAAEAKQQLLALVDAI
uniref:VP6 n=1 Tax=Bukakata virus TaxID=2547355 RepID=A0A482A5G7_9REOV|nr:VP6 [Bukakata virus]